MPSIDLIDKDDLQHTLSLYLFVHLSLTSLQHLRSYRNGACLYHWYFDRCAARLECYAADTESDKNDQTSNNPITNRSSTVVLTKIHASKI